MSVLPPSVWHLPRDNRSAIGRVAAVSGSVRDRDVLRRDPACLGAGDDPHLDLFPPSSDGGNSLLVSGREATVTSSSNTFFGRRGVAQGTGAEQERSCFLTSGRPATGIGVGRCLKVTRSILCPRPHAGEDLLESKSLVS
jgi:hypothetical protein